MGKIEDMSKQATSFQKVLRSAIDFVIVKTELEGGLREPLVRLRRNTLRR